MQTKLRTLLDYKQILNYCYEGWEGGAGAGATKILFAPDPVLIVENLTSCLSLKSNRDELIT